LFLRIDNGVASSDFALNQPLGQPLRFGLVRAGHDQAAGAPPPNPPPRSMDRASVANARPNLDAIETTLIKVWIDEVK